MFDVDMRYQLVFSAEGNITLSLTLLVRAHKVGNCKVSFQVCILLIVHVFIVIPAQMAGEVLSIQVIDENQVIEEIFLAKVTPRMGKDLCLFVCTRVSLLNMLLEELNIVEPLFSDKDETTL